MTYAVIVNNTVVRTNAKGKSPSEVLRRYLAKEWVQSLDKQNVEVMTTAEFKQTYPDFMFYA